MLCALKNGHYPWVQLHKNSFGSLLWEALFHSFYCFFDARTRSRRGWQSSGTTRSVSPSGSSWYGKRYLLVFFTASLSDIYCQPLKSWCRCKQMPWSDLFTFLLHLRISLNLFSNHELYMTIYMCKSSIGKNILIKLLDNTSLEISETEVTQREGK